MISHIEHFFSEKINNLSDKLDVIDKINITIHSEKTNTSVNVSYNKLFTISNYLRISIEFNNITNNIHITNDVIINIPHDITLFKNVFNTFTLNSEYLSDYSIDMIHDFINTLSYLDIDREFQEYISDYFFDCLVSEFDGDIIDHNFILDYILLLQYIHVNTNNYFCENIILDRQSEFIELIADAIYDQRDYFIDIMQKIRDVPILLNSLADRITNRLDIKYQISKNMVVNYVSTDIFCGQIKSCVEYINSHVIDNYKLDAFEILVNNIEKIMKKYCYYYDFDIVENIRKILLCYVEEYTVPTEITNIINQKLSQCKIDDKIGAKVIDYGSIPNHMQQAIHVDFTNWPNSVKNNVFEFGYVFCTTETYGDILVRIIPDFVNNGITLICYGRPIGKYGARLHFRLLNKSNEYISYDKTQYAEESSIKIVISLNKKIDLINRIIIDKLIY